MGRFYYFCRRDGKIEGEIDATTADETDRAIAFRDDAAARATRRAAVDAGEVVLFGRSENDTSA